MSIKVVNMVPKSLSGERYHDRETSLTVNATNSLQIAASAFTPEPSGRSLAPIYVSNDGGDTWILNPIVPALNSPGDTFDISLCFSGKTSNLYAGILLNDFVEGQTDLNILRTDNYMSNNVMTVIAEKLDVDQPFIKAESLLDGASIKDRIYMAINDFNNAPKTATIYVSLDSASANPSVSSFSIEKRNTAGQNMPAVRPAIHSDGTVYAAFYGVRSRTPLNNRDSDYTGDVVVVRDDQWATSLNPFSSLLDPGDNIAGRLVASNVTVCWRNRAFLGQERIGGDLAITVHPKNSSIVYIAWTDKQPNSDSVLHIRSSKDRGKTWSSDLLTLPNSKNPSLAINADGILGLLYQQFTDKNRWDTHFLSTKDDFHNTEDSILATVPVISTGSLPYNGDYDMIVAVDKNFYGIFTALNIPDLANFPSGVSYQRNSDFTRHKLIDVDGMTEVPPSMDCFFFKVT